MAGEEEHLEPPPDADPAPRTDDQLAQVAAQLRELSTAKDRLQGLLNAVLAISQELNLPAVLHRIVTTAMDLVGARYGALGVLDESGEQLGQFITAGLSKSERADLSGIESPRGRGVLGHLIHHPEPLRVVDIPLHPASAGIPPGHPPHAHPPGRCHQRPRHHLRRPLSVRAP